MRAITIWQPWASLIMIGAKPYEFRGRSYLEYSNHPSIGERIVIHAGARDGMSDHGIEFDCCECGGHVVRMIGPMPDPRLCAACLMLPGWYDNPELRATLDPHRHCPGPKAT